MRRSHPAASTSLLSVALVSLAAQLAGCPRKDDGGTSGTGASAAPVETASVDAVTGVGQGASSSGSSPGAASGPTICRDGGLYDLDGNGLALTEGQAAGEVLPAVRRDARLALYATVSSLVGALPQLEVSRQACRQYESLRACFLDELVATPTLAGDIDLQLVVGVDGVVGAAHRTGGSLTRPSLVDCLARAFVGQAFTVRKGSAMTFVYALQVRGHPLLSKSPVTIVAAGVSSKGAGKLPAAPIERIVDANMARIEACYERGLSADASLKGTMGVSFVIETTGSISHVATTTATMPDAKVVSCVLGVFGALSLPAPIGGSIEVIMPLSFDNAS